MPWPELSPMNVREQFIAEWESGAFTMTELCADYGVSRKTGHKWVNRHEAGGRRGLCDQSRRPHTSPHAIAPATAAILLALRRRFPRWGATKLLTLAAEAHPRLTWPSRSTICDLFRRHGLVKAQRYRRRRRERLGGPFPRVTHPNELWTTDFKGEFRTGDGRYCYPLTLRDASSRFVLRCHALLDRGYEGTRRQFERAFAEYGLPERIRSDNGHPFAGIGLAGLSQLSVWWIRLGIGLERIAPGRPEQNGSHEQFHAVLKAETTRPPAASCRAQQRRFTEFCHIYNTIRPHAALDNRRPAHHYHRSPRPLPKHIPPIPYPPHLEIRRVSSTGSLTWRCHALFLGTPLAGQDVAFEEIANGVWTIRFADIALGRYHDRTCRFKPIAPTSVGRSRAKPARADL